MKARKEINWVNKQSAKIIPFPVKKPAKLPNMKCMKTDIIDWRF